MFDNTVLKDSLGRVIKPGMHLRINKTIVKTVKWHTPDLADAKTMMCVTLQGLDIPFSPGYGEYVSIHDLLSCNYEIEVI